MMSLHTYVAPLVISRCFPGHQHRESVARKLLEDVLTENCVEERLISLFEINQQKIFTFVLC